MKDAKKTLKWAGIIALLLNILNISNLLLDIFYLEYNLYNIIVDSVAVGLTFLTGISYLVLHKKSTEHLIKRKGWFLALTIINIFNDIFVWIVSLWVDIVISNIARYSYMKKMFNNANSNTEDGSIQIEKDDYEIKKETENLTEGLKDLENLKSKGLITEEEYNELRQSLINKYIQR